MLLMHRKIASVAIPMAPLQMKCARREYSLGDEVTFDIKAVNETDETQSIVLTAIEGLTFAQSTFENVPSKGTVSTTATYTMTEADILHGVFTATITAEIGENEYTTTCDAVPEAPNGHITITCETTSSPNNGDAYDFQEEIDYYITVTNSGNLTITDIRIIDEWTGDEWTIDSLAPEESYDYTANCYVTQTDILNGEVVNVVTASGDSPDPDEPDVLVDPDEDVNPTVEPLTHASMSVTVTSSPANGTSWTAGEWIDYRFVFICDGNMSMLDGTVYASSTSEEITNQGWESWTFDCLDPGDDFDRTASWRVTAANVASGTITIPIYVTSDSVDPNNPYEETFYTNVPVSAA